MKRLIGVTLCAFFCCAGTVSAKTIATGEREVITDASVSEDYELAGGTLAFDPGAAAYSGTITGFGKVENNTGAALDFTGATVAPSGGELLLKSLRTQSSRYVRLKVLKQRPFGLAGNPSTLMEGPQLGEFRLLLNDADVLYNTAVAQITCDKYTKPDLKTIIDNNVNTKCYIPLGRSVAATYTIDLGTMTEFNGYKIYTGNDCPGRDPYAWTVETSVDGEVWTLVSTVDSYVDDPGRSKAMRPYDIVPRIPFFTGTCAVSVPQGTTLAVEDSTLALAAAQVSGGLRLADAQVTLAGTSAYSGSSWGEGELVLDGIVAAGTLGAANQSSGYVAQLLNGAVFTGTYAGKGRLIDNVGHNLDFDATSGTVVFSAPPQEPYHEIKFADESELPSDRKINLYHDKLVYTGTAELKLEGYEIKSLVGESRIELGSKLDIGGSTLSVAEGAILSIAGAASASPLRKVLDGCAVTVPEGAELRLFAADVDLDNATIAGGLRTEKATVRVSGTSAVTGAVTGSGTVSFDGVALTGLARASRQQTCRYYRFVVKATRGNKGPQMGELSLFDDGVTLVYKPSITEIKTSVSGVEPPYRLIDGMVTSGTKVFIDKTPPVTFTLDLGEERLFDGFGIYSGNDVPARDPYSWTFESSADGENWVLHDTKTQYSDATYDAQPRNALLYKTVFTNFTANVLADSGVLALGAGGEIEVDGVTEEVGTLAGEGQVTLSRDGVLVVNAAPGNGERFTGRIDGTGTLVIRGGGFRCYGRNIGSGVTVVCEDGGRLLDLGKGLILLLK